MPLSDFANAKNADSSGLPTARNTDGNVEE
jgi:hypothetical protein